MPPRHLLLGDVYREVSKASPRLEAARALARAAEARIASAKLPPDPELQLGFMNYTLPGLAPMESIGMAQLQLMQMVPTAGKLSHAGRIASGQAAAQVERANEVAWELRANVAMAFYDLYETDQALAVARETLQLLHGIRRTAEAMYRVGEGRQADVLRAQVEIARMAEDTIRMTTMRSGLAAGLNALLDRPAESPVASPVLPAFPDSVPPLDALLGLAESARPMVRAAAREVEAAEARVRRAKSEIWPDLTIGVQYGLAPTTMPGATGTDGIAMPGERKFEQMGSVMIGVTLPIFARSRQLRMREEAAAMQQMAVADLAALRAETRAHLTQAYAALVRARNLSVLYRTTVLPQAEATLASALAAYRVGSVDFMTLLDDQMTVNRYRREVFTLEAEQGKALAELEMLTGRELFDADAVRDSISDGGAGTSTGKEEG